MAGRERAVITTVSGFAVLAGVTHFQSSLKVVRDCMQQCNGGLFGCDDIVFSALLLHAAILGGIVAGGLAVAWALLNRK